MESNRPTLPPRLALPLLGGLVIAGCLLSALGLATLLSRRDLFGLFLLSHFLIAGLVALASQRCARRRAQPLRRLLADVERFRQGGHVGALEGEPDSPLGPIPGAINHLTEKIEDQAKVIGDQRHRQQVLLSNMSEGILAVDNEEHVTVINALAAEWLDAGSPHRARGKILHAICRNPTLLGILHDLFASGEAMEKDLVLERLGEENRILHVRGSLMIDAEQTVGALLVMRDVSALRKLETLRRDFVANVSHELRTPLASIKGYAEILCDAGEDREMADRFAEKILRQSERMVEIIDDLLALTRIENNPSPPSMQATQIRPLLEEVLRQCETQAAGRGLTLVLDAPEDLCASLHAPLVEQAMFNLVNNAVKYTHPNTRIHVRAAADHGDLVLEVRDEGPGIEAQHQDRIFERFYRIDKARNRAVGGSGLGLSIVKHIAQVHQGTVALRSAPGQGATFLLRLPLRPTAKPAAPTG